MRTISILLKEGMGPGLGPFGALPLTPLGMGSYGLVTLNFLCLLLSYKGLRNVQQAR